MRVPIGVFMWVAAGLALARGTTGAETITFGTDWKAEAEHGGYYQAVATGIYRQHGLDVTLRQGGPQVNHAQLLAAGRLDFNLAPNSFIPLNFVQENIPILAVAAIFQNDPAVLIAHPTLRQAGAGKSRPRAALCRRQHRGLVQLSSRRSCAGQRADQTRQSGDDRRASRLWHRQDQGIRHRRQWGRQTERHWGDDR